MSFLDALAHANPGVEAPLDDVHVAFVIRELDLDIRIGLEEPGQQRLQHHRDRDARRIDAQQPGRTALQRMQLLPGLQHVGQRGPNA